MGLIFSLSSLGGILKEDEHTTKNKKRVSHYGHLGGFTAGILVFCIINKFPAKFISLSFKKSNNFFKLKKFSNNYPLRKKFSSLNTHLKKNRYPYYLIGANIIIFFVWNLKLTSLQLKFDNLMLSIETIEKGNNYTLLTSSFSQHNFNNLLGNMLWLFYFGRLVEQSFGPIVLLELYFAGALLGGLFSLSL